MDNPNEDLFDANVRRRIFLERKSTKDARALAKFLREVRDDLITKIARYEAQGRSRLTIKQQQRILKSVEDLIKDVYARMRTDIDGLFVDLARDQIDFEVQSLSVAASADRITAAQANQAFRSRPMEGRFLKDWLRDLPRSHRTRIQRQIQIAFTEGESLTNVKSRIRDATRLNEKGLTALIRTANTHIASSVSYAVYEQNEDLVSRYQWRAILDSRTTPICRSRDGNIYKMGEGNPLPPAHVNCRSTTTPILDDFPPPPELTYGEWLRKQPAAVQDEILGPRRAKLFRKGKYTVKQFVDKKGKQIPLKELER